MTNHPPPHNQPPISTSPTPAPNRLIHETSPYLLQHAHNPVDWRPWGEEAIAEARRRDVPLLVSVGYSACHWCHVMERESFEDADIAALMNRLFVCVKIDREERPDLDELFMRAVQMLTGSGGWPMTVFLTPDLQPFFGGTYYPPEDRRGHMGFPRLLERIAEAWGRQRDTVVTSARNLAQAIQDMERLPPPSSLDAGPGDDDLSDLMDRERAKLLNAYDPQWGGFGSAPKFPAPAGLLFLLNEHRRCGDPAALAAVRRTLTRMAEGGIHDHLGGGFHRYSVDRTWTVPHFEKMLYDNALLALVYLEAWRQTGEAPFLDTARTTLEFLLSDMRTADGAFVSALDADTDGEEGKYYVWRRDEIFDLLPAEVVEGFCQAFSVTEAGNFEAGATVLRRPADAGPVEDTGAFQKARSILLEARRRRTPPGVDHKALTAWNAMVVCALARFGAATGEERFVNAARETARFLRATHRLADGALTHGSVHGRPTGRAFLDDIAWMALALLDLWQAGGDLDAYDDALALADQMIADFADPSGAGMFFYAPPQQGSDTALPARPRKMVDEAVVHPNAVAWEILWRLEALSGKDRLRQELTRQEKAFLSMIRRLPEGNHYGLAVADRLSRPLVTVVVAGAEDDPTFAEMGAAARRQLGSDGCVLALEAGAAQRMEAAFPDLARGKSPVEGRCAAYVCRGGNCLAPVCDTDALIGLLKPAINGQ